MIEPVIDALTTSIRPAGSAKNAMISSAMLPNVALRMPPTCGPETARAAPSRSRRPRRGRGSRRPLTTNTGVRSACRTHSRTIATAAISERPDERDPGRRDRGPRIGHAAAGGLGMAVIVPNILAFRGRRTAAPSGCRSRRDPPRPRRRRRARRRRAARPRRRAVATSVGRRRGRRPRHRRSPTTTTNSPRSVSSPPGPRPQLAQRARGDLLVELGELAADRGRPLRAARRRQVPQRRGDAAGRLEQRPSPARRPRSAPAARAAPARSAAGTPRTPSAAPGCRSPRAPRAPPTRPGSGTTRPPSAAHAATSSPPGSLTSGVPASVTSATSSPPRELPEQLALVAPGRSARGS